MSPCEVQLSRRYERGDMGCTGVGLLLVVGEGHRVELAN